MPAAKIHEVVAKVINDDYKMDEILLRLGTISPDCWRNTPKESKYHNKFLAHFNNDELDRKVKYDYDKFYKKYKDKMDNPFYFGYLLHLIVDCYWKTNVDPFFTKKENGVSYYRLKDGSFTPDVDYFEYYDGLKLQRMLSKKYDLGILPINIEELDSFICDIEEIDLSGLFGSNGTVNYVNEKTIYKGEDETPEIYDEKIINQYLADTIKFVRNELNRLIKIDKNKKMSN